MFFSQNIAGIRIFLPILTMENFINKKRLKRGNL